MNPEIVAQQAEQPEFLTVNDPLLTGLGIGTFLGIIIDRAFNNNSLHDRTHRDIGKGMVMAAGLVFSLLSPDKASFSSLLGMGTAISSAGLILIDHLIQRRKTG